ncbi:HlyD family secretion protein [Desulforamulus ruminis]|uniref:Secretion protein HlyD family protein n=1 Tax=Desulforamulus ruminis (strain ATCC 23193 / DSM 2154 / NCIMB 8452 / DL) TaxID=696281 RepID=F6DPT6_DESRL|nr:HlyD family efflux transporter periplasmic adaptor subunit [Desulforamulus ruminis]AEG60775.1 secretion protein HlyD family protein [Desulforamulus ruminis DSM 2154]
MKNKKILLLVFGAMLVTMAFVSYYYWYQTTHYVTTEDARVDTQIVKITPQVAGKILEIPIEEGELLKQNDIVARLSDAFLSPGANLDLTILRSPITGTVLKKIQNTEEMAAVGQPLALMADLNAVYITANIEETELSKVHPGQIVDFTIDAVPNSRFQGYVESIGEGTNSSFSSLSASTSGTFTKVTQRIPVKIAIQDLQGKNLLPGMNAVIKIHLK